MIDRTPAADDEEVSPPTTDTGRLTEDDFRRAGLYDPDVDAGTGRLELLRWLADEGFELPTLRAAGAGEDAARRLRCSAGAAMIAR